MAAPNKKNALLPRIKQLHYEQGLTLQVIAEQLGVHPVTISKWFKDEGLTPAVNRRRPRQTTQRNVVCDQCGTTFQARAALRRRFCSRGCTNDWQREHAPKKLCRCGKEIKPKPGAKSVYTYRQFCSTECRRLYGKPKPTNPNNHVTFTCETCGKRKTRYKGLSNGKPRFCSNLCASKHTKKIQHIAIVNGEDDSSIVVDSAWEGLLYTTARFCKFPIERFDRGGVVIWTDQDDRARSYGPDFLVTVRGMTYGVEIKGQQRDNDVGKWAAWCAARPEPLVVLDRERLEVLRKADKTEWPALFGEWAWAG